MNMNMLKRIAGLMALGLLLVAGSRSDAQAQNLKVGYTDHEVIIAAMPDYRTVQQQLQQEYQSSQASLQTRAEGAQQLLAIKMRRGLGLHAGDEDDARGHGLPRRRVSRL